MKRKFGQQFHKYQQSKNVPLITPWAYKNMIYDVGHTGSNLEQAYTGGRVYQWFYCAKFFSWQHTSGAYWYFCYSEIIKKC
jgi:hypothetical protein